ncbi:transposase family protein [Salmonella enterica subsp. enterica]|uniref:Transposase family protein n=10 Tax=Salmonella enterica TaxID=28901 RepID=A0A379WRY2_SALET|nr:transposase family protein [Salmonella enterica subsp. enterica]
MFIEIVITEYIHIFVVVDEAIFILFVQEKKKSFLATMTLINFVAANQKNYAFNLLSVFIMVFWSVILISNMQTDINHNEK